MQQKSHLCNAYPHAAYFHGHVQFYPLSYPVHPVRAVEPRFHPQPSVPSWPHLKAGYFYIPSKQSYEAGHRHL